MDSVPSSSVLASYATFRELYNSKKYSSPYQILSEFLRYIICTKSLFSFTASEIQWHLKKEFGFDSPLAVIVSALRSIKELTRVQHTYQAAQLPTMYNSDFRRAQQNSLKQREELVCALLNFANEQNVAVDEKKLQQELLIYILDENGDPLYKKVISEFVFANKDNTEITEVLTTIQEGGILYTGLAYNISELGSLKQPIILYLDTEILFDIAGLNGTLFKSMADDFLSLVRLANQGKKMITLRYFCEVAEDIDMYFSKAEKVVNGSGEAILSYAMGEIVKGCSEISDVVIKKTKLYADLATAHSIRKDDKESYYSEPDVPYNLEGIILQEYPYSDPLNYEGIRFCSHINVLRKGEKTTDLFKSKFLFITDTRRVLDISRALTEQDGVPIDSELYCGYAVSLSHITNLLWYKLNRGFSSVEFPKNLDSVIKSRIVLSGYITQGITAAYKDIKNKAAAGALTHDQATAYILALKEKPMLPEDLDPDNIANSLDFSEEHLRDFSEILSHSAMLLKERDTELQIQLDKENNLKELLAKAQIADEQKQQQIKDLAGKLRAREEEDAIKAYKETVRKSWCILIWDIAWKVLLLLAIVVGVRYICKLLNVDFGTWLSNIIGLGGLAGLHFKVFVNDYSRHKERCKQK